MLEHGPLVDLGRLRLAPDLRALAHLPVAVAKREQRGRRGVLHHKQPFEVLDGLQFHVLKKITVHECWTPGSRTQNAARSTHRYRKLREPSPDLPALAHAGHPEVSQELGEAPQTRRADRVQPFLELVLLPVRPARHDVRPARLQRRERRVGGQREEGVLVQVALDHRPERAERGREQIGQGRDEGRVRRAEGVCGAQGGQLEEQVVLLLQCRCMRVVRFGHLRV